MSDFISRQAAIDALMEKDKKLRNINWYDNPYAEGECGGIDEALSIISNLPSAQPEIVRCKDCMYWIAHNKRCVYLNHGFAPNMWCCHGERRTDGRD